MIGADRPAPVRRERGRRRRLVLVTWAVRLGVALLLFGVGVAVGEALRDNPKPGDERTFVRTLKPLPIAPQRETVTITATVTGP